MRPYYQDELSRAVLSDSENYLLTYDGNIFIERAVQQGWKFYHFYGHSLILIIYDKESKELDYAKNFIALSGYISKYRVAALDKFMNNPEILDNELLIPIMSKKNLNKLLLFLYEKNLLFKHNVQNNIVSVREDLQYFDVFEPIDDEIIVDAGCYDGAAAKKFLQWGGDKVKKIYSFEFYPINAARCEENLKDFRDKIILVKKGTWDKDETLYINARGDSETSVQSTGNDVVYLTTIDSVVKDEKVTFIKMDVEGAELKSLMGARNTIMQNKPRLAICVYHEPEDICAIPEYILSLVPEYRFYLRHYSSIDYETVLYASCD